MNKQFHDNTVKLSQGRISQAYFSKVIKDDPLVVQRMSIERRLTPHNGCVNTICWNGDGRLILSGSDDQKLSLSDAFTGTVTLRCSTPHRNNIFTSRFLDPTDDSKVVSGCGGGRIVYTDLEMNPSSISPSSIYDCHLGGAVYEVLPIPLDPSLFLSCGSDGHIRCYDLREARSCTHEDHCSAMDLFHSNSSVMTITLNPQQPWQLAAGCADSGIRIWDRRMTAPRTHRRGSDMRLLHQFCPAHLISKACNITSIGYSEDGTELLASYSGDYIYLFDLMDELSECDVTEAKQQANWAQQESSSGSTAWSRLIRFRGDWSDTGPTSIRQAAGLTEARPNLMQRMSEILSNMLGMNQQQQQQQPAPPITEETHNTGPSAPGQPHSSGPSSEQPHSSGPSLSQPHSSRPRSDQPHSSGPSLSQPHSSRPRSDQPHSSGPSSEQPYCSGPDNTNDYETNGSDSSTSQGTQSTLRLQEQGDSGQSETVSELSPGSAHKSRPCSQQTVNTTMASSRHHQCSASQKEDLTSQPTTRLVGPMNWGVSQKPDYLKGTSTQLEPNTSASQQQTDLDQYETGLHHHPAGLNQPHTNIDQMASDDIPGVRDEMAEGVPGGKVNTVTVAPEPVAEMSAECLAELSGEHSAEVSGELVAEVSGELVAEVSGPSLAEVPGEFTAEVSAEVSDVPMLVDETEVVVGHSQDVPHIAVQQVDDDSSVEMDEEEEETSRQSEAARRIQQAWQTRRQAHSEQAHSEVLRDVWGGPGHVTLQWVRPVRVKQVYRGHRNCRTVIKEACFWGKDYVMSGSDCGHIFTWKRKTGQLAMLMEGDAHVVNCLQPNQYYPVLASSGVDYDIKIWSPSSEDSLFDPHWASQVQRCNEEMLPKLRGTVTLPAAIMLHMFSLRARAQSNNQ